ncbi:hypothetical protein N7481_007282 [Penicillium waksmanii]|uniref:uncharacterized protein n=1 Tax=Penicillium waksmanii TaxID=69791 RepID=UPI002548FA2A|nr:uncharacterized protein N7481_007282 [Penicillium waksmanii]KAJ5979984.1 hypothetical protein N7481_007282 [Penicillium waksmanii]
MLEDPDYIPPEGGDYSDPGEFDSEYESVDSMSLSGEDDEDVTKSDSNGNDEKEDTKVDSYSKWLAITWNPHARFPEEPVGTFGNFGCSINRSHDVYGHSIQPHTLSGGCSPELEHFPSERGREANAYSGYAISPEEMIGCRTAQCLVHKSAIQGQQQHIKYFDPWEASEDWFLSGLCDGMPSRDCSYPEVWPAQGGVDEPRAENINFDVGYLPESQVQYF